MSGMFHKPKVQKPPTVPTVDEAAETREALDKRRNRRGASAAMLTGALGDTSPMMTASKRLLGA